MIGMVIVDYFMTSASASDLAVFVVAFIFAIDSMSEIEEEKQEKKELDIEQ